MTKPIVLTEDEAHEFARHLTDQLFQLGSAPGSPVQRIAFMGGEWPNSEIAQGGMCYESLVTFFKKLLLARSGGEEGK